MVLQNTWNAASRWSCDTWRLARLAEQARAWRQRRRAEAPGYEAVISPFIKLSLPKTTTKMLNQYFEARFC